MLPYIDFSAQSGTKRTKNTYMDCSGFVFWEVKQKLFDVMLEKGAKGSSKQKVKIHRLKASKLKQAGKCDWFGEITVFGQVFQHYKTQGYDDFKCKAHEQCFTACFTGEGSIDVGGPYNETMTCLCTELQSTVLPLFI
jgi:hypothetical protein